MTTLPISLSSGFQAFVKSGDTVAVGDVLAKRVIVDDVVIDISAAFSVSPKKVKKYLRRNPGDLVSTGDILASKSKMLGMQEERIISHVTGTFAKFDRGTGKVTIILQGGKGGADGKQEVVLSPIDGVIELCDNDQIHIGTDKNIIVAEAGIGESVEAEIFLLDEGKKHPEEVVIQIHHLDTKIIDKIFIGGVLDREVLIKAIGMGAKGIVGAAIRDEDLSYIEERALGIPILRVEASEFVKIAKWSGKRIFMQGNIKTILFLQ